MTWHDHLGIIMSNVDSEVCDKILRRYGKASLRSYLQKEVFYMHQPECSGGYSNERCPCAWSAKAMHVLLAVLDMDAEWFRERQGK